MKTFVRIKNRTFVASSFLALTTLLPAVAEDINVPVDYPTIQAAVDAASSGDTIRIAPGVYVEQVIINGKNLTIVGAPGAVIRAGAGLTATIDNVCSVYLFGVERADVVIKGLTFEGEHLSNDYECNLGGILFNGASGRVEDCTVRGFRGAANLFAFGGNGVAGINNLAMPLAHFEVLRCHFADNGLSIHVRGADGDTNHLMEFVIADNVIKGIGPTTLGSQNGILISEGASGLVLRNTITDHNFTTEPLASTGIFAVDWRFQYGFVDFGPISLLPVRYEGNTFRNNQLNLASALGHGSQFANNTFEGSTDVADSTGLAVTGLDVQIVANYFAHMARGVWLVGDDPNFHTRYGVATNTTLTDNRFCDLTTRIDIEPLVTGTTNQGTLVCPFPSPKMTIAPAVLISWPSDEGGWVLESAPTVTGPWESTGITPSLQSGQNTVAVKTDAQHQFFRLTAD